MIIDTSAVIALVQHEDPHAAAVVTALADDRSPAMTAPSIAECLIVLTSRHGPLARTVFDRVRSEINLRVVSFGVEEAFAAQRAYMAYGKGRHPAALNFGDAMSYAAAKVAQEPLIAVGNDFPQTDLEFDGVIGRWPKSTPS